MQNVILALLLYFPFISDSFFSWPYDEVPANKNTSTVILRDKL